MRLEARGLGFRYGKGPWLFRNLNFALEAGERIRLGGPSGAGKSTLARLLAGFAAPGEGRVLLDGQPLPKRGYQPVQLVLQHPEQAVNPRWRMQRALEEAGATDPALWELLGIERAWLTRFPGELSGGELQRFCLARALAGEARFLLLDEITAMLDALTQAQLWTAVLEIARARNLGLLVIAHDDALAERVCTGEITLS